jgi:hypothetical protein
LTEHVFVNFLKSKEINSYVFFRTDPTEPVFVDLLRSPESIPSLANR